MADPHPLPLKLNCAGFHTPGVTGIHHNQGAKQSERTFHRRVCRVAVDVAAAVRGGKFQVLVLARRDFPGSNVRAAVAGIVERQLMWLRKAVVDADLDRAAVFGHDRALGEVAGPVRSPDKVGARVRRVRGERLRPAVWRQRCAKRVSPAGNHLIVDGDNLRRKCKAWIRILQIARPVPETAVIHQGIVDHLHIAVVDVHLQDARYRQSRLRCRRPQHCRRLCGSPSIDGAQ